jgi:hypothetical protein
VKGTQSCYDGSRQSEPLLLAISTGLGPSWSSALADIKTFKQCGDGRIDWVRPDFFWQEQSVDPQHRQSSEWFILKAAPLLTTWFDDPPRLSHEDYDNRSDDRPC